MVFRSAVDWWYYLLIVTAAAAAAAAISVLDSEPGARLATVIAVMLVTAGLPVWLLFATSYLVDSTLLHVRSGPFRWTIRLNEIRTVRASRSALSSPALSLKRMEIIYGSAKSILVSPADRQGFLTAIGRKLEQSDA